MAEAELARVLESPPTADTEADNGMQLENGGHSNGEENGDHDGDGNLNTNYDSCDGTITVRFIFMSKTNVPQYFALIK
jgi:hypothetical protein